MPPRPHAPGQPHPSMPPRPHAPAPPQPYPAVRRHSHTPSSAAAATPRRPLLHPRPLRPPLHDASILPRGRNPHLRSPLRDALLRRTRRRFTHLRPPLRGSLHRPPSPQRSTPAASLPPPSATHTGWRESRRRPWWQGRLRRPQTRWFLSLLASKKNSAAHDSPAKNTRSKQYPLSKRTRSKSDGRYCPRRFTVKTIHYVGECGFNFHFNSFRGCCMLGVGTTSAVCNMKVELESLQFSSRQEIDWNWIRIRKQPSRPFDQLQQQQSMVGQMEKVASPQVDLRCSGDRFCS